MTHALAHIRPRTLAALRGGEVHHFAIVVTDSGRKIYQLRTDTGNALAGTLDRV
jgi:hypothetical protein